MADLGDIIQKYDFLNATAEDESALSDDIHDVRRELNETGTYEKCQRCVSILQEKNCHKGFPLHLTPACWMSVTSIICLKDIIQACVEDGRMTLEQSNKMMFEFFLACLETGPSTSHGSEFIPYVLSVNELDEYLGTLMGDDLNRVLDTIANLEHTPEQPHIELREQATNWGRQMISFLKDIVKKKNKERLKDPAVHEAMADLHLALNKKMVEYPQEFSNFITSMMNVIKDGYGGSLHQETTKGKGKKEKVVTNCYQETLPQNHPGCSGGDKPSK
ncbi:uncharacterized protein LOC117333948 [Pecten maximus]|uniref:uncharacterized protein LOC117333948 n=1 Tax=Pecten maximus TaxID=6579 RepID=UPI0014583977|nr:uncharacterized protein LOC117333948 [Pecten maximus]